MTYPRDVAGMVQVDAAFVGMRVGIGGGKTMRLGDDAKGRNIPAAREEMKESDKPTLPKDVPPQEAQQLDPLYKALPEADQKLQLWAQSLLEMQDAEGSQMDWSGEYFGKWMKTSQAGTLGTIPLVVLTRAEGGYGNDQDVPAAQMEKERKEGQAMLVKLSSNSKQVIVKSGHNMDLEAPDDVTAAIRMVVEAVRKGGKNPHLSQSQGEVGHPL
jgi:pimeloyl-ACP methyl ester carboxylesterase